MPRQDNFDEEVLTPEERLMKLLERIEIDMAQGKLSAACKTLEKIGKNQLHLNLMESLPFLKSRYNSLNDRC